MIQTTIDTLSPVMLLMMVPATFFWANLFARSEAAPKWIVALRKRGKPWSCPVCMSWWLGMWIVAIYILPSSAVLLYLMPITPQGVVTLAAAAVFRSLVEAFILTSALAGLSIIGIALQDRLETFTFH